MEQPATDLATPRAVWRAPLRFALHYVEMVIAMFVGMALGPLWSLLVPGIDDRADVHAIVMASDMAVTMGLWMRIRKHAWARIGEMCAAMYLPFVVLLVPYWLGLVSGGTLSMLGHVLMFPAMLAAMLARRADYYHRHDM